MATGEVRDRLQPALLDRLTDDNPGQQVEADERRVMSKAQLRQAVLRDLGWLFNATQPLGSHADLPQVLADSVLNFGLPALSGQLVSRVDISQLERSIRQAILRFEPRLLPESLKVVALEATHVLDTHNTIEFEIRGHLWAQPVPLEVLLRTKLDLEAGQVEVRDASGSTPSRHPSASA
ncbi:MAG: type VI secretion system baseplate subunit TssE [Burkholderiaceae bacterium]|jgi:type VI secretion system protein ImpF|nr:type VI secretion system baseplate subunit TssE [Aquabacterium sp.]NUP86004.1 type VI secretion system baseplate subunit TssE [Burkholderiaceae bacterium]